MDCYRALCLLLAVTLTVAAIDGPCSSEDRPVCGQDDQTYKNKCEAEMAYVTSLSSNFFNNAMNYVFYVVSFKCDSSHDILQLFDFTNFNLTFPGKHLIVVTTV